jgi:DNA-binding Lrp family transcriptional regulator
MNSDARHELSLLEAVEQDGHVTQRRLASKLGIAVGLTNIYLKRLVRKGFIKCINLQSNRLLYLITPSGVSEKARLTYEYMEYSIRLYRDARLRVRTVLEPLLGRSSVRVAIYGTGEAAELTYLCLKELGVHPVAVFGDDDGQTFFDLPVRELSAEASGEFDTMVLATFDEPAALLDALTRYGIAADRIVALRAVHRREPLEPPAP